MSKLRDLATPWSFPNATLYTGLVFGEAYCFELMLVIILAAMPLTLDRQAR